MDRHDRWADSASAPVGPAPTLKTSPVETEEPTASVAEVAGPIVAASELTGVAAPARENEPEPAPQPLPAADAALKAAAVEQAAAGPESEPQPPRATEAPPKSSTDQQTLFTLPPATTDRWAQVQPNIPGRIHVEWPAGDSLDAKPAPSSIPTHRLPWEAAPVPAPKAHEHVAWPPIGASWPAQGPAAPWPVSGLLQASVMAAPQAEAVETESPLVAALWAESAQQVLDRGTVRVCHHCALPVSTQARYCRRCGTEQA
jgi:ribosomal protein L40E